MAYRYNPASGRYYDVENGRFVSEGTVRAAVDQVADAASGRLAALTDRLRAGDLKLADWQREAMATIKESHVAAGVVAQGGRAQMTQSAYGFLGHEIRDQYVALRDLANGIAAGDVPLDGRLVARAGMYGQHARVTYEAIRAREGQARGETEERSILHAAQHCDQCRTEAGRGWVTIGTLVPIGQRQCLVNCRCTIERRVAPATRAASYLRAIS